MKRKHKNKKEEIRNLALSRIKVLFKEAEQAPNQEDSDRYVEIARKLAMKAKVKMPKEYKSRFCRHCSAYFTPKLTRVRTTTKTITYLCSRCSKFTRFGYKNPKQKNI